MKLTLNISSSNLDAEGLQSLTRKFCHEIKAETDIQASLSSKAVENGKAIGLIELGVIILTFLSSDAGKGLIELVKLMKDFFRTDSSLEIQIQKSDGTVIKITAKNVKDAEQILIDLLKD